MNARKTLLLGITTVLFGTGAAQADSIYPDFLVDEAFIGGHSFTADKMVGGYIEQALFNQALGTFDLTLLWNVDSFYTLDGTSKVKYYDGATPAKSHLTEFNKGNYGMYGLVSAHGTFAPVGSGNYSFTFQSGNFGLYLDHDGDTQRLSDSSPLTAAGLDNTGDDVLLASSNGTVPFNGGSLLTPTSSDCTAHNNCGSFGVTSPIALTVDGKTIFTNPAVFYGLAISSGQFNNFDPLAPSAIINGSMDVTFQPAAVPLPTTAWLLLSGLMGVLSLGKRKAIA